jgi:DNA-binding transcriptional MerR regulator
MPVIIEGQTYYRTAEVYRSLGISKNTLYRWLQKESIGEAEHRDSRGWRLFTQDELDKLDRSINRVIKIEHSRDKERETAR